MRPIAWIALCMALPWLAGCGTPSFLITPVASTSALQEHTVMEGKGFSPPKIALVEVEGAILNLRSGGFLQPTENMVSRFTQEMDRAARDPQVKAVVLRINSPGGTVTASDILYQTVVNFRKKTGKPVIASVQDVGASGAYYIACGSDHIIAHPTSVVGSIGVIATTFHIQGTLAKIGAQTELIKSGALKSMGSPFRELDPEARKVMQDMVDDYYTRFVNIVKAHRPITDPNTLKLVTDGRVFSGNKAAALGLVDRTGLLTDAIDHARSVARAPGAKVIHYRRPYGYTGSIYAQDATPQPQANVLNLNIPGVTDHLPSGFYYLWQP